MSTRSQIVIKDKYNSLVFYRHSDGYPDGNMPALLLLMKWVRERKIRSNAEQVAGWLIIIGAIEYNAIPDYETEKVNKNVSYGLLDTIKKPEDDGIYNWKCGAYEPATCRHGDIEYLYILDLDSKTITCYSTPFKSFDKPETEMPGKDDNLLFVDSVQKPWKKSA